jgi:hypothetical protein
MPTIEEILYEKDMAAALAASKQHEQADDEWQPFFDTDNYNSFDAYADAEQRELEAQFELTEEEVEADKAAEAAAPKWPSAASRLPPIMTGFLSMNPPPPSPPDAHLMSLFDTYSVKKGDFDKKQEEAKKSIAAKQAEIQAEESKPATFGGKWSSRAAGGSKEETLKRLAKELDTLTTADKVTQQQLADLKKKNEALIQYMDGHHRLLAMHEKYLKDTYAGWNKIYGTHTPIKSLDDVLARYSAKAEVLPSGLTHVAFEDDMKVGQAIREMQLGLGPSRAMRAGWSTVQVLF